MATPEEVNKSLKWYAIFSNVMNLTGIVSLVSILFMVFTALAGIMMIIAGRLPGAGQVTSAFFWSIGIVALLLPWPNFIPQAACLPIGIADFSSLHASLTQLACGGGSCPLAENVASIVQVWVRFVLFPVIIFLIDIMYLARTRQAAIQIRALALAAETRTGV
jgi:hypothetical protein